MKDRTTGLDTTFIRRVYRTSVVVYAVVAVYTLGYAGFPAWLGLTAGVLLAMGSLRLIEWSVERFVGALRSPTNDEGPTTNKSAPSSVVGGWSLVVIAAGKYGLLGLVVAGVVWLSGAGHLSLPAFVGGIALVHAVIALKAVGAWLVGPRRRAG